MLLQSMLWLGIAALYLGFAGVMGVLLRSAHRQGNRTSWWLAGLHGGLVLAPASLFILRPEIWPPVLALSVFAVGLGIIWLGAAQPDWTPPRFWQATFGQRYFGSAMLVTAAWSLFVAWRQPGLGPAILAATSIGAALASLAKQPQRA